MRAAARPRGRGPSGWSALRPTTKAREGGSPHAEGGFAGRQLTCLSGQPCPGAGQQVPRAGSGSRWPRGCAGGVFPPTGQGPRAAGCLGSPLALRSAGWSRHPPVGRGLQTSRPAPHSPVGPTLPPGGWRLRVCLMGLGARPPIAAPSSGQGQSGSRTLPPPRGRLVPWECSRAAPWFPGLRRATALQQRHLLSGRCGRRSNQREVRAVLPARLSRTTGGSGPSSTPLPLPGARGQQRGSARLLCSLRAAGIRRPCTLRHSLAAPLPPSPVCRQLPRAASP